MKKVTQSTKSAQAPSVRLAVDNTERSANDAGLRWRGDQALSNLRAARAKLTWMMRNASMTNRLDDETYEIMASTYGEILDALAATEESIEATVGPTEDFRRESEAAAAARAK